MSTCSVCGHEQWAGGRQHVCQPRTTGQITVGDTVRRRDSDTQLGSVVELRRGLTGGWSVAVKPAGAIGSAWWPSAALEVVPGE